MCSTVRGASCERSTTFSLGLHCLTKSKPVGIPADPHAYLLPVKEKNDEIANVPFREAIGSLMFLAIVSRPDIAFVVNAAGRFTNNHNESLWRAIKRIIAYVNGTVNLGIEYRSGGRDGSSRILGCGLCERCRVKTVDDRLRFLPVKRANHVILAETETRNAEYNGIRVCRSIRGYEGSYVAQKVVKRSRVCVRRSNEAVHR